MEDEPELDSPGSATKGVLVFCTTEVAHGLFLGKVTYDGSGNFGTACEDIMEDEP